MNNALLKGLTVCTLMALAGCGGGGSTTPDIGPTPGPRDYLYVAERANDVVDVLNSGTGQIYKKIPVGHAPVAVEGLVGSYMFVANSGSNTISVIDTKTNTVVQTLPVGSNPVAMSLQTAGTSILAVANAGDNTFTLIDALYLKTIATVPLPGRPSKILAMDNQVAVILPATKTIEVYDTKTSAFTRTFTTSGTPLAIGDELCGLLIGEDNGSIDGVTMHADNQCGYYGAKDYTVLFTLHITGSVGVVDTVDTSPMEVLDTASKTIHFVDRGTAPSWAGTLLSNTAQYTGTAMDLKAGTTFTQAGVDDASYLVTQNPDQVLVIDKTTRSVVKTFPLTAGGEADAVGIALLSTAPAASATTPTPAPTATPTAVPTATPTPVAASSTLYVANGLGTTIETYASPIGANSVPSSISYGGPPSGIAFDGSNTLAVQANSNVYLYNGHVTSSSTPFATLATNVSTLMGFDPSGNLYVGTHGNSVYQFKKPFTTGEQPTLLYVSDNSSSVAFDSAANMYVANFSTGHLGIVAPPYANNSQVVLTPASGASLSAVAVHAGMLYVADTGNNAIYAYTLPVTGSSMPSYTYAAADPEAIAFDAAGHLYVSNDTNNRVDVYSAPSQTPLQLMSSLSGNGLSSPYGLAIGP